MQKKSQKKVKKHIPKKNLLFFDKDESYFKKVSPSITGYKNIYYAGSVDKAWEILEKDDIHVAIINRELPNGDPAKVFVKEMRQNDSLVVQPEVILMDNAVLTPLDRKIYNMV